MSHERPRPADDFRIEFAVLCTGVSAVWCPIHGDCTCPQDVTGMWNRLHDERQCETEAERDAIFTCSLHGRQSQHAD